MNEQKVQLKRSSRILSGHLWVFSNEILGSLKRFEPGEIVEVSDRAGHILGTGYINPHSLIAIRLLSNETDRFDPAMAGLTMKIDKDFLRERIKKALDYRKRLYPDSDSFRVVYSEGDLLPGLIVDKYNDVIVLQTLTAGMERLKDVIVDVLDELFHPASIVLRNDSPFRRLEGLALEKGIIKGEVTEVVIKEAELSFYVDTLSGQKTGFFLDQRENRIAFRKLINKGKGLDLFCYSGAWAIHMAACGADVIGVDESDYAIEISTKNAELNKLSNRCRFLKADVFDFIEGEVKNGSRYDFIVLDPPAFVKSREKIREAAKAYRKINASAMRLLNEGGLIATSSCSHHISREAFLDILRAAARDAGRRFRLIEMRSQAKDHPVLLSMPETEYLKCAILEVL
ncbi:MAG: class I SAM-dependent rRNA methyltransferase [Thermodesulfovibrionales bacterium]